MARIEVERERENSFPWLWVILGLIVLALLVWWLIPGEEEPAAVPVATEPGIVPANPPPAEPVAQGPFTSISDLMTAGPAAVGATFAPVAPLRVTEVISDRAFWVEDAGQRLLVVINEGTMPTPTGQADVQGAQAENPNVNQGQTVRITEGVVQDPTFLQNLQGPIEPETRQALQGQRIFLVTDGRNIQIAAGA